jgi:hypothetical protein
MQPCNNIILYRAVVFSLKNAMAEIRAFLVQFFFFSFGAFEV